MVATEVTEPAEENSLGTGDMSFSVLSVFSVAKCL
jgi:hypothetical protein